MMLQLSSSSSKRRSYSSSSLAVVLLPLLLLLLSSSIHPTQAFLDEDADGTVGAGDDIPATPVDAGPVTNNPDNDCPTFECYHNSTCQDSTKVDPVPHPDYLNVSGPTTTLFLDKDGKHCACLPGYTGLACDASFETCEGETSATANSKDDDFIHACYYGGKCLPGLADMYGNDQMYCDCTDAKDENGTQYAGKYCEHKAVDICVHTHKNEQERTFCVNGGLCKRHFTKHPEQPCQCDDYFVGPHCEFAAGSVPDCTLECQNEGICRLGLQSLDDYEAHYKSFWQDNHNYMYCECKAGFYGHNCETSSDRCSASGDRCFNGGTCVSTYGDGDGDDRDDYEDEALGAGRPAPGQVNDQHMCDCSTADGFFAGRYCQDGANDFCDEIPGTEDRFFCVNGGTCSIEDGLPKCTCKNSDYYGPKCEYERQHVAGNQDNANGSLLAGPPDHLYETVCPETHHLKCENGGQCSKGSKKTTRLDAFIAEHSASFADHEVATSNHDDDMEHCICPVGYSGLYCNIQVETCTAAPDALNEWMDEEILCFHGAKCTHNPLTGAPVCDCASATTSTTSYAGEYCQHISTSQCSTSGQASPVAFCVNYGACRSKTSDPMTHTGCSCPREWGGEHCEEPLGAKKYNGAPFAVFIVCFMLLGMIFTMAHMITYQREKDMRQKEMDTGRSGGGRHAEEGKILRGNLEEVNLKDDDEGTPSLSVVNRQRVEAFDDEIVAPIVATGATDVEGAVVTTTSSSASAAVGEDTPYGLDLTKRAEGIMT